jgi:hypothetical protein
MKNQKTATCDALLSVYKDRTGQDFKLNGEVSLSSVITSEDKKKVREILLAGFQGGTITMSEEGKANNSSEASMKKYVDGLINNWIRKEKSFNGGSKYEIKNPGSRAGSGDETVKNLKVLLAQVKGSANEAAVQEAIDKRLAEIKPTKAAATINVDALPENLRHLVK